MNKKGTTWEQPKATFALGASTRAVRIYACVALLESERKQVESLVSNIAHFDGQMQITGKLVAKRVEEGAALLSKDPQNLADAIRHHGDSNNKVANRTVWLTGALVVAAIAQALAAIAQAMNLTHR